MYLRKMQNSEPNPDLLCSELNDILSSGRWDCVPSRIQSDCRVRFLSEKEASKYPSYKLPKEIKFVDSLGRYPLHIAVMHRAPSHIVSKIIDAYPPALKKKEMIDGWFPLHLACMPKDINFKHLPIDDDTLETIELLSKAHPFSLIAALNSTPLHLVCEHNPPLSLIKTLMELSRGHNIEQKKDIENQIPLHVALDYQARPEVIRELLKVYPDGAKKIHKNGFLPLHYAALRGCTHRTLVSLLREYPEGVEKINQDKDTPLHLLFTIEDYSDKWTCEGNGESRTGDILNVEDVVRLMLKYFAKRMREKRGEAKGNMAVRNVLTKIKNCWKMSVMDMAEQCHNDCDLPETLIGYLRNVAQGKIIVETEDEMVMKQEDDNRECDKTSAKQGRKRKAPLHDNKKKGHIFECDTENEAEQELEEKHEQK